MDKCKYEENGECVGYCHIYCENQEFDMNPDGKINVVYCRERGKE